MKGITHTIAAVVALASGADAAEAQAFGIAMGTPLESLTIVSDNGGGTYQVKVPKPHSEFETYLAVATPETGVCRVGGVGKSYGNDRFGNAVQKSFVKLKDRLVSLYGEHYFGDFLRDGALWDALNEWVMAINQNERVYQAVWDADEKSKLPGDLKEVMLNVAALGSDSSYLFLRYTFANHERCQQIITDAESGGL